MYSIDKAEMATILAALRHYQQCGLGDPAHRSDAILDIATSAGEVISLDANAIDTLCERLNCTAEPRLAVVLEGGVVADIVSDQPSAFANLRVLVIDYDDEGADPADLTDVPQAGGKIADAIVHAWRIDRATIDLAAVETNLSARA